MMMKIRLCNSSSWLYRAGYNRSEEDLIYMASLDDVFNNIRWYLDNLDNISEFRVSWKNYRNNRPTLPLKCVTLINKVSPL